MAVVKRRTQAERSLTTQKALLEAARSSLSDRGYAGTTTAETAKRAKVSRGAQLHHYATKQDLLIATIDYIHAKVETDVEEITHRIDGGTDEDIRLFICGLWNVIFSEENFNPNIELVTAARTNPELGARLQKRWKRLAKTYETVWEDTLERSGNDTSHASALLTLTLNFLRGMAMQRIAMGNDPDYFKAQLEQWTDIVRLVLKTSKTAGEG
jgi:AcrR family transcriptional regulator